MNIGPCSRCQGGAPGTYVCPGCLSARERAGSTRVRLAALLNRCIPEIRGQAVEWRPEALYPCRGFWRIRRTQMDVMSWQASAYNAAGRCVWNGGCWETMTECLKAGHLHIYGRYHDTLSPESPSDDTACIDREES